MGQLADLKVKNAEHCAKEYFLPDGDRLYLRVRPTRKVWVYRYTRDGKSIKLSLGRYPVVSLAAARRKARAEMARRADGIDPQKVGREKREQELAARLNTFELVAREWHKGSAKDRQWSAGYAEKIIRYLELHVFPWVGRLPVEEIKPTEVCAACIASKSAAISKLRCGYAKRFSMCISIQSIPAFWSQPGIL